MHILVSTRGSLYGIPDGTRLCTNCARIQSFHTARDSFERKADSPICWKRWQLEVREGAVRVEFGAPKAGSYVLCQNCAKTLLIRAVGVSFERKADSPSG